MEEKINRWHYLLNKIENAGTGRGKRVDDVGIGLTRALT